jgi:hypothetical protein
MYGNFPTALRFGPQNKACLISLAVYIPTVLLLRVTCFLRCVHITRARAGARQAFARRETRLAFTGARKSSSTLLQLLAKLRRVRIRIFTRSVYRL